MNILPKALVLILGISLSVTASALDMDFYTYGGFAETVNVFTRLAIIFNDYEYLYLFAVTCVFGIMFGGIIFFGKQLLGGFQGGGFSLGWLFTVILGVAIFKGLVIPKGTIHIYDPVKNNYKAVGNVPDLIILYAGAMNKFERIFVEVTNASSAYPYGQEAGGVSFELLYNASSSPIGFGDAYMTESIKRYYKDCSFIPLNDDSSSFDFNRLFYTTDDIMTELEKLRNPADFTVYKTASNKKGITLSCEQTWDNYLKPYLLTGTNFDDALLSVCKKSGFNVASIVEITRCKELLARINKTAFDVTNDHIHLLRSMALSKSITDALLDQNPDTGLKALTNKALMMDGLGTSSAASDWLPVMKSVITTIVLALTPLLICLIVTPLVWKSLFLMFGLYIWLTLWGCVDVIMHGIIMDQAINVLADIKQHKMGVASMITAPEASLKALAIFGKARSMGVTLATVIAASVFGFSGYAMAGMASNMQGTIDKEGTDAANKSNSPAGHAQQLDSLNKAFATEYNNATHGFDDTSAADAYNLSTETTRANTIMDSVGQGLGTAKLAGQNTGGAGAGALSKTMEMAHAGNKGVGDLSRQISEAETGQRIGGIQGEVMAHAAYGETIEAGSLANSYVSRMQDISSKESITAFKERFDLENGFESTEKDFFGAVADIQNAPLKGQMEATGQDPERLAEYYKNHSSQDMARTEALVRTANHFGMDINDVGTYEGMLQGSQSGSNRDVVSMMKPEEIAAGSTAMAIRSGTEGMAWLNRGEQYEGGAKQMFQDISDYKTSNDFAGFLAFSNTAEQMDKTNDEMALATHSSGITFSFNAEDVPTMLDNGMIIDPKVGDALIAQGGGTMTSSFDPKTGHSVTATSRTGESFVLDSSYQDLDYEKVDSSRTDDRRTSIEVGHQVGSSSVSTMLINEEQGEVLETQLRAIKHDDAARENMIMSAAGWLSGITSSSSSENYTNHRDFSAYLSASGGAAWKSGDQALGFLGKTVTGVSFNAEASGGLKGTTGWTGTDSESDVHNTNYAVVRDIFEQTEINAERSARAEVNIAANQYLKDTGSDMSYEQREALFDEAVYDNWAEGLNDSFTSTVADYKENNQEFTEGTELSEQVKNKLDQIDTISTTPNK